MRVHWFSWTRRTVHQSRRPADSVGTGSGLRQSRLFTLFLMGGCLAVASIRFIGRDKDFISSHIDQRRHDVVVPGGERRSGGAPLNARALKADARLAISLGTHGPAPAAQTRLVEGYGKLPLSFEANYGQTDAQVKFLSRGSGYGLFLTGDEAVLGLKKPIQRANGKRQMANVAQRLPYKAAAFPRFFHRPAPLSRGYDKSATANNETQTTDTVLRMRLIGANTHGKVSGLDPLPGKNNYFLGNDPKKWRTNVPNYAKVKYEGVYPGVDLVYYGNQRRLEYDFVVAPGADPGRITLDLGAGQGHPQGVPLQVTENGDLVVQTGDGEVRFHKPVVYQRESAFSSQGSKVEEQTSSTTTTDSGPRMFWTAGTS